MCPRRGRDWAVRMRGWALAGPGPIKNLRTTCVNGWIDECMDEYGYVVHTAVDYQWQRVCAMHDGHWVCVDDAGVTYLRGTSMGPTGPLLLSSMG